MADSIGVSAHGTLIKRNGTTIAELRDITPPPLTRKSLETSIHNNTDDQYVVGMRRTGELAMMVNFLSSGEATHQTLLSDWADGTKSLWNIAFPDGASWSFSGFVVNVAAKEPVDGAQEANIGIRPTGLRVFAPILA